MPRLGNGAEILRAEASAGWGRAIGAVIRMAPLVPSNGLPRWLRNYRGTATSSSAAI
jgi:hypothetical protein